jgi:hypothetical protein
VRLSGETVTCRNCGLDYPESRVDARRWCDRCRGEVIRRARLAGRLAGIITALALMAWIFAVVGPGSRFLVGWMALVVATYVFVSNLSRRVAFEVIRGRGVKPPGD